MLDRLDSSVRLVQPGKSPDPEVQSEAFRLWVENGRSVRIVAQQIGCDQRTIRRWADSEQWEQKRVAQAQAFLPGARVETSFALKLAAHNASLRLQQIAFHAAETGEKPDVKEVQALTMIVDRGGYSPVGSRNPIDGDNGLGSDQDDTPDFNSMSRDELRQYELSKKKRRHSPQP